jgi:hypothetical protein
MCHTLLHSADASWLDKAAKLAASLHARLFRVELSQAVITLLAAAALSAGKQYAVLIAELPGASSCHALSQTASVLFVVAELSVRPDDEGTSQTLSDPAAALFVTAVLAVLVSSRPGG